MPLRVRSSSLWSTRRRPSDHFERSGSTGESPNGHVERSGGTGISPGVQFEHSDCTRASPNEHVERSSGAAVNPNGHFFAQRGRAVSSGCGGLQCFSFLGFQGFLRSSKVFLSFLVYQVFSRFLGLLERAGQPLRASQQPSGLELFRWAGV